ncbi:MAG: hypothetical protein J6N19_02070, partial [Clostridium sp.]|nr:hypothetical protein [Clostridium sp.]
LSSFTFIFHHDLAVCPITQSGTVAALLCVRIMLRGCMTQSSVYLNAQDSFSCTGSHRGNSYDFGFR